ncbi:YdcH family protein [Aliiroseovarius sp. S1339]|uniref:YdcH family protein n=1 Tax=Aliiroseovarius sp. S1339 TaxID=2936990 RepID=UPI0020BE7C25|nr:YdcH family protein [Aliiroseovarius sp. S1339]MCK8465250.1 YdcH family protein [Aliiroseovarius sp. S1339]
MSHTPHELHEEFPEFADKMTEMKQSDAHFAKLSDEYHDVNRAVHRAETNVEPTDQFNEEEMRKKRAVLKDQIYRMLSAT